MIAAAAPTPAMRIPGVLVLYTGTQPGAAPAEQEPLEEWPSSAIQTIPHAARLPPAARKEAPVQVRQDERGSLCCRGGVGAKGSGCADTCAGGDPS